MWDCVCKCGNSVSYKQSVIKRRKSCGCLERNQTQKFGGTNQHLHYYGGTHIDVIKNQKLRVNNTSGFRGVCKQHGKWKAQMQFRGKLYSLGAYDNIDDAVKARLRAEEEIVDPFLAEYFIESKSTIKS